MIKEEGEEETKTSPRDTCEGYNNKLWHTWDVFKTTTSKKTTTLQPFRFCLAVLGTQYVDNAITRKQTSYIVSPLLRILRLNYALRKGQVNKSDPQTDCVTSGSFFLSFVLSFVLSVFLTYFRSLSPAIASFPTRLGQSFIFGLMLLLW